MFENFFSKKKKNKNELTKEQNQFVYDFLQLATILIWDQQEAKDKKEFEQLQKETNLKIGLLREERNQKLAMLEYHFKSTEETLRRKITALVSERYFIVNKATTIDKHDFLRLEKIESEIFSAEKKLFNDEIVFNRNKKKINKDYQQNYDFKHLAWDKKVAEIKSVKENKSREVDPSLTFEKAYENATHSLLVLQNKNQALPNEIDFERLELLFNHSPFVMNQWLSNPLIAKKFLDNSKLERFQTDFSEIINSQTPIDQNVVLEITSKMNYFVNSERIGSEKKLNSEAAFLKKNFINLLDKIKNKSFKPTMPGLTVFNLQNELAVFEKHLEQYHIVRGKLLLQEYQAQQLIKDFTLKANQISIYEDLIKEKWKQVDCSLTTLSTEIPDLFAMIQNFDVDCPTNNVILFAKQRENINQLIVTYQAELQSLEMKRDKLKHSLDTYTNLLDSENNAEVVWDEILEDIMPNRKEFDDQWHELFKSLDFEDDDLTLHQKYSHLTQDLRNTKEQELANLDAKILDVQKHIAGLNAVLEISTVAEKTMPLKQEVAIEKASIALLKLQLNHFEFETLIKKKQEELLQIQNQKREFQMAFKEYSRSTDDINVFPKMALIRWNRLNQQEREIMRFLEDPESALVKAAKGTLDMVKLAQINNETIPGLKNCIKAKQEEITTLENRLMLLSDNKKQELNETHDRLQQLQLEISKNMTLLAELQTSNLTEQKLISLLIQINDEDIKYCGNDLLKYMRTLKNLNQYFELVSFNENIHGPEVVLRNYLADNAQALRELMQNNAEETPVASCGITLFKKKPAVDEQKKAVEELITGMENLENTLSFALGVESSKKDYTKGSVALSLNM